MELGVPKAQGSWSFLSEWPQISHFNLFLIIPIQVMHVMWDDYNVSAVIS